MVYRKSVEVKIIRVKHIVEFSVNARARSLKDMLRSVPDDATVDEVLADDDATISIEFHEERVEK